jgi:hypothetical protein
MAEAYQKGAEVAVKEAEKAATHVHNEAKKALAHAAKHAKAFAKKLKFWLA